MRIYKFRWFGTTYDGITGMYPVDLSSLDHNTNSNYDFNLADGILMQYTGLKDKNGKEICEGDILLKKCRCCLPSPTNRFTDFDELHVIVFDKGSFKFKQHVNMKCNHYFAFHYQDYEVIGNIYENPELVKGKLG